MNTPLTPLVRGHSPGVRTNIRRRELGYRDENGNLVNYDYAKFHAQLAVILSICSRYHKTYLKFYSKRLINVFSF
jgi:hypothetical protein